MHSVKHVRVRIARLFSDWIIHALSMTAGVEGVSGTSVRSKVVEVGLSNGARERGVVSTQVMSWISRLSQIKSNPSVSLYPFSL